MIAKTLLYCTRKCGCEGGVVSARCRLQPPHNSSIGQVHVLEHKTFSRNTSYEVFLGITHAVSATAFAQPSSCHSVICCCIAAACLVCRCCSLVQTKNSEVARRHPGGLGTEQTISPLVRVLDSFEHEAGPFCTRHQNPYTVAT